MDSSKGEWASRSASPSRGSVPSPLFKSRLVTVVLRGVTVIFTITGFRVTSSSSQFSSRDSTQFSDSGSADDVDEFEIHGKHCQSVTKERLLLTILLMWSVWLSDPQRDLRYYPLCTLLVIVRDGCSC